MLKKLELSLKGTLQKLGEDICLFTDFNEYLHNIKNSFKYGEKFIPYLILRYLTGKANNEIMNFTCLSTCLMNSNQTIVKSR